MLASCARLPALQIGDKHNIESPAANGWRQFELLVSESFGAKGMPLKKTGLGGAYGSNYSSKNKF